MCKPHFRTLYTYFELEECFPDSIGSCVIRIILCEVTRQALIERTTQFLSQSSNAHIDMKCSRTCSEVKVLRVLLHPATSSTDLNRLTDYSFSIHVRCAVYLLHLLHFYKGAHRGNMQEQDHDLLLGCGSCLGHRIGSSFSGCHTSGRN